MLRAVVLAIGVLGGFNVPAFADCWKTYLADQNTETWRWTDKHLFIRAYGDYNGDNMDDYAEIRISCKRNRAALFVFTRKVGGSYHKRLLASIPIGQVAAYGVQTVPPGTYEGACKKGYFDCAEGQ